MDGERWFGVYRATFFVALLIATIVRLYVVSGFLPELVDRASGRFLGGFDLDLWTARLGSAAMVLTLAAGCRHRGEPGCPRFRTLGEVRARPSADG